MEGLAFVLRAKGVEKAYETMARHRMKGRRTYGHRGEEETACLK